MKGYAPWPAKITKVERNKYSVYFYGTSEVSQNLKSEDLFEFVENKSKFVTEKNLKRKFFSAAVQQIERAIEGKEDSIKIDANTKLHNQASLILEPNGINVLTSTEKNDNLANVKEKLKHKQNNPVLNQKFLSPSKFSTLIKKMGDSEKVSRSGRKIKPKKYLDATENEYFSQKRKQANFLNEESKKIKTNIDSDVEIESNMLELDHMIKSTAGLNGANPDKCILHLNEFKQLNLNQIILKKHPNCVETIKRLRRYVGNVKTWDMEQTMIEKFNEQAKEIRSIAEEIYNNFKKIFEFYSENLTFWEYFMEQVKVPR